MRLCLLASWLFWGVILPAHAQQNKKNYALLWEITGKNLKKPSYLFGSMHSTDKRVFEFCDSMMWKFRACEAVAVEANLDSAMQSIMGLLGNEFKKGFQANRQKPLKDFELEEDEDEDEPNKSDIDLPPPPPLPIDKNSLPSKKNDWGIIMSVGKGDKETFLDAYLAKQAKLQRKKLFSLEHYTSEQMRESILEGRRGRTSDTLLNALTKIYQSGDLKILQATWEAFQHSEAEIAEFIHRNYVMLESMERIMPEHSLFAVVGAAHLVGKEGLLKLLEQKGYTVRKVTATFTGKLPQPTSDVTETAWHTISDSKLGFVAQMPFEPAYVQLEENMQVWICPDVIDTGLFYLSLGVSLPQAVISESEFQTFTPRLADSLKIKMQGKIVDTKSIEIAGKSVYIYTMVNEMNEDEAIQMAFMLQQRCLYFLWVGGTRKMLETTPYAERFFTSFQAIPAAPRSSSVFKDEQGAFSVWLPDSPTQKRNITPDPSLSNAKYDIRLFMARGEKDSEIFMVRYNDFPTGYAIIGDSIYFANALQTFEQRLGTTLQVKTIEKEGYRGREAYAESYGIVTKMRMFLRGNRFYLLMTQTEKKTSTEDFFDSFSFLPFKTPELKKQYAKDSAYTALFPYKLKKKTLEGNKMQTVTDKYSGTAYVTTIGEYEEYDFVEHTDTLWKRAIENLQDENDSIVVTQKGVWQGVPYQDILMYDKAGNIYHKIRTLLRGKYLYTINACGAKESVTAKYIDNIFNSIQFDNAKDTSQFSIFQSKANLLLSHLWGEDEKKASKARSYLYRYDFQVQDIPLLVSYLDKPIPHKNYERLHISLIDALVKIQNDTIPQVFKTLYESKKFPDLENYILINLWKISTPQAKAMAYELAHKRLPQKDINITSIAYNWTNQKLEDIANDYKKISENTENQYFRNLFVCFSAQVLRTKKEAHKALVLPEIPKLIQLAEKYYALPEEREHAYDYAEIYKAGKSAQEYQDFLKRLLALDSIYNWHRHYFLEALLEAQIAIEPQWIEPALKDSTTVTDMCLLLMKYKQMKPFEKYCNPEKISKYILNEEHEDAFELKFLGKEQVKYKGKKGWIYAYEYDITLLNDDLVEDKTVKRIAIVGLFLTGKNGTELTNDFTESLNDEVAGKTWREKVKNYVKEKNK